MKKYLNKLFILLLVGVFIFPLVAKAEGETVIESVNIVYNRGESKLLDRTTVAEFNAWIQETAASDTVGVEMYHNANTLLYTQSGTTFTYIDSSSTNPLGTETDYAILYGITTESADYIFPAEVTALDWTDKVLITDLNDFSISFNGVNRTDVYIGYYGVQNCLMAYVPMGKAEVTHEVDFATNGGSAVDTMIVRHGSLIPAERLPETTRAGYVFDAWYKNDELTEIFEPEDEINADTVLYAKWKVALVTVAGVEKPVLNAHPDTTFSVPDGADYTVGSYRWYNSTEGRNMSAEETFEAGKAYQLDITYYPNEGHDFAHRTDMTATLDGLVAGTDYSTSIFDAGGGDYPNRTVYYYFPQFVSDRYLVQFNANGGTGEMESVWVDRGAKFILPQCTFTAPEGKEFKTWNLGREGQEITVNSAITLTAQWRNSRVGLTKIDNVSIAGGLLPVAGMVPFTEWTVSPDAHYKVTTTPRWTNNTDHVNLTDEDVFVLGKRYRLIIDFTPDDGYYFEDHDLLNFSITGMTSTDYSATIFESGGGDYPNRSIYVDFYETLDPEMFKITSVELHSNVVTPVAGANIPTGEVVTITSINGDSDPEGILEITQVWQEKTGDGFFDWQDVTGTFVGGKTYHVRMLMRIINDYYTFASGADEAVTINDMTLTRFQLNKKSIGEFSDEYYVEPTVVNSVTLAGVVAPVDGEVPTTEGITSTTPGVSVKEAHWYRESSSWEEEGDATIFAIPNRYILLVILEANPGYVLADDIGEDRITTNADYLMAEYVKDGPDVRISYEVKPKVVAKITKAPTVKVANANDNTVLVSWNSVANATSYEVLRSTDKKKWTTVGTTEEVSFVSTGLTYGKTYYFKVKAKNESSSKTSSVVSGKTVPNKVTGLTVTGGSNSKVKLAWGSESVTGYEVYMGTKTSNMKKVKTITSAGTFTYTKSSLKTNTTYYFKVRAYKTVSGKKVYGSFSANVKVKTAPSKPKATFSLVDYETLKFAFTGVKGATYYVAGLAEDANFSADTYDETSFNASDSYTFYDVPTGKTLYIRIKSCNSYNLCSGWTVVSKKSTPKAPAVKLTTASKKVTIALTGVTGAEGYEVYKSTKKSGKYTLVKEFTTEDIELSYVNTTKKGKTYYYKVRSYKVVDGNKVYSPYSSVKSIRSK